MARSHGKPTRFHLLAESLAHRDYVQALVITTILLVSGLVLVGKFMHARRKAKRKIP